MGVHCPRLEPLGRGDPLEAPVQWRHPRQPRPAHRRDPPARRVLPARGTEGGMSTQPREKSECRECSDDDGPRRPVLSPRPDGDEGQGKEFIKLNAASVVDNEHWGKFVRTYPDMVTE